MGKVWSINNNFGENKKIKENYIFILSFILPMVIMFVVFTALGVGFIGEKTIVSSDMYTQYVAYFGKFKDVLSGDGSIICLLFSKPFKFTFNVFSKGSHR